MQIIVFYGHAECLYTGCLFAKRSGGKTKPLFLPVLGLLTVGSTFW